VAVTFGNLTISRTLVAYRISGLDWMFTNVTAGATHMFVSPETPGANETGPISPNTFEMRVTNVCGQVLVREAVAGLRRD
jgi:hypothetical protein